MCAATLPLPPPVEWKPGLIGEYPGQVSRILVGSGDKPVPMDFGWCPPSEKMAGFWMARHPVNQGQWQAVMGKNPSEIADGSLHPVDSVSWDDAQAFCAQVKPIPLRLPREAEWEYACRAGTTTEFGIGDGKHLNAQLANFDGNYPDGDGRDAFKWKYRERAVEQGQFPPNAWGLHDMHGQLWEWCQDKVNEKDSDRVLRGGCWIDHGGIARSALRDGNDPDYRGNLIGFRPCLSSTSARKSPEGPSGERSGAGSEARDERNERPA